MRNTAYLSAESLELIPGIRFSTAETEFGVQTQQWPPVVVSAMFGDRMTIQVTVTNIYDMTPYLAERF